MVRLTEFYEPEYPLPELTEDEQAALEAFNADAMLAEIQATLPAVERKRHKVTDIWGNTIKRYATKEEALEDCKSRNASAKVLGLWMRYRIGYDQGFDEK